MITCASAGGVSGPKFIVPRQRRLTDRPERPKWTYSMLLAFHSGAIRLAVGGDPLAGAPRGVVAAVHVQVPSGRPAVGGQPRRMGAPGEQAVDPVRGRLDVAGQEDLSQLERGRAHRIHP